MEDARIRLLREAVEALAMEAQEQLRWLSEGQMPVDELALVFDDIYIVLPKMQADGVALSDEVVELLNQLDAQLDAMSGQRNHKLWTEAALTGDPRWNAVRQAAIRALQLLPVGT